MTNEHNPEWILIGHKHLVTEKIFYLSLRGEAQHLQSYVLYTWACNDNRHIRVILTQADEGIIFETKLSNNIEVSQLLAKINKVICIHHI